MPHRRARYMLVMVSKRRSWPISFWVLKRMVKVLWLRESLRTKFNSGGARMWPRYRRGNRLTRRRLTVNEQTAWSVELACRRSCKVVNSACTPCHGPPTSADDQKANSNQNTMPRTTPCISATKRCRFRRTRQAPSAGRTIPNRHKINLLPIWITHFHQNKGLWIKDKPGKTKGP